MCEEKNTRIPLYDCITCSDHLISTLHRSYTEVLDQQLVGKLVEVCWRYFHKDTNGPMLIWSSGRIVRVADGLTDKHRPQPPRAH